MDDFLGKPVKAPELAEVLERWATAAHQPERPGRSTGSPAAPAVIDFAVLESFRELQQEGEPDLVIELMNLYYNDTQARLAELRTAFRQQDVQALQRVAHSLKGGSSNLGVRGMMELSSQLEETLASDALVKTEPLLNQLEEEFARVADAFAIESEMVTQ